LPPLIAFSVQVGGRVHIRAGTANGVAGGHRQRAADQQNVVTYEPWSLLLKWRNDHGLHQVALSTAFAAEFTSSPHRERCCTRQWRGAAADQTMVIILRNMDFSCLTAERTRQRFKRSIRCGIKEAK
jgi:hypothetical protein